MTFYRTALRECLEIGVCDKQASCGAQPACSESCPWRVTATCSSGSWHLMMPPRCADSAPTGSPLSTRIPGTMTSPPTPAMYGGRIIGLIVAESKAQSQCNREDAGLLATNFPPSAQVAYILTLGVVRECRRNGIATLLLDSLLAHLSQQQPQPGCGACKAVYLHVLASNTCAIQFYERRCFRPHAFLPLYYSVRGAPRDGYSYVLYINGGHPPWTLLYPFQTMALHGQLWACYGPARTLIKHASCALRAKADKQWVHSIHSAVCELVPAALRF
ncbi:N-alpha-acetyltransferase 60 isoform X1 [Dermacentor andersoni]|uniref:N-alpha-acetyltransferase 60 isoform X1 n=1 Tax=Dermacentor andersoni TaxID=34620 RepID=UPI002417EC96|nr:N-alpha-acetyltransferase 60-like isoform X1 [Dermacentor andersoni]